MNLRKLFTNRVVFRLTLVLCICSTTAISYAQTSKEYTDADVDALITDIESNAYNEYILSTDGGSYVMSDVDLAGDALVKAKEGLVNKPIVSDLENTGTYRNFFDIQGEYNLTVQGIEFDGTATELMMGVSRVRADNASITMIDCYIHDFTTSNGIVRCDKAGVSVTIEGCFINNCKQRLVYLYDPSGVYGDVSISNTTFANSAGSTAIFFRSSGGNTAGGTNLTVDHCTFYKIPGPAISVDGEMSGTVSVTNSLFVEVSDSLSNIDVLDYCYLAGIEKVVVGSNSFTTAPVFADTFTGNFQLTNADAFVGSDGKTAGDLSWYPKNIDSNEYSADEIERLIADITASTHSEYILTTSGGAYDLTAAPDISVTTTIKSADDLENRPVLSYTLNESSSFGIFRVRNASERISVTFDNLEFDCSNDKGNVTRIDSEIDLFVKNCFIHGNTNSNGSVRVNTASSVSLENTLVTDCKQRVVSLYTPDAIYGAVSITNCSFNNIAGPVVYYRSSGGKVAIGTDFTVNHATFNNIGGSEGVFKLRDMQGIVVVKNSIFEAVAGTLDPAFASADFCYIAGFETAPTATNSIETAPVFANVEANNFTLTNSDQLSAGDLQILGDLTWYDDVFAPKVYTALVKKDSTHLMLEFNEIISTETAAIIANYELSGTFGLTGNPLAAVVSDDSKSVVLELADLSAMLTNQTVIVTVSNVTDIIGNVIADNNVATYTYFDETAPTVSMTSQEATNDAGSTITLQSTEAGMAYLIMDGEAQDNLKNFMDAIEASKGASALVELAGGDVSISTEGLLVGTYYAYAIDAYNNISVKSENSITITDLNAPVLTLESQEVNNAKGSNVIAALNEAGTIYLVLQGEAMTTVEELDAAVSARKGAKANQEKGDSIVSISVVEITPGIYSAVAVDLAGNISAIAADQVIVSEYVPSIRYYAVEDAVQLSTDIIGANDGDIFVLTTSGGDYALEAWHKIVAKITIMADENVTKRPVISNYRESSTYQTFRLYADGASLTLKGIEIDSKEYAVNPVKYMLRVESNIGNYSLVAEDCYFHGALKSSGVIVKTYGGTHGDSLIFRNCIFEDSEAISMTGLSSEDSPSWDKLEISNCTFINIPDAAINIKDQPSVNKDYPIEIDHCTFYNTGDSLNNIIRADSMSHVSVTNSIFAKSTSSSVYEVYGDAQSQSTIDFNNFYEVVVPVATASGVIGTNVWNLDPQFANAETGDLTLGNQELYSLGNDQLPLGDLRWADVLGPKVLAEIKALSDTTLLVSFSEWIDSTSAIIPENYILSGSAGLAGVVKAVELYNFRSVIITTESFIGGVGLNVIVTVADVEDLKGNKVDANNNGVTYTVEEMRPVVFANEQNATNGEGEMVIVQGSLGSGYVYIVLESVAQASAVEINAAVSSINAAKEEVTAGFIDVEILTYGITPGTYYAYFIDGSGVVSEKGTNKIIINDGIAPLVLADIQSADNGSEGQVFVQTNEDNGRVYIILDGEPQITNADFITAVALKNGALANVTEANINISISTTGLATGIYYAYAIDAAGNISQVGDSPINITKVTGVERFFESNIDIYSANNKILIQSEEKAIGQVFVFNLNGQLIDRRVLTNEVYESKQLQPGIYLVKVVSNDDKLKTQKISIY